MPGPLAGAIATGLGSSLIGGIASSQAADAQSDASDAQLQLQADMFNRQDDVSRDMLRRQGKTIRKNALRNDQYALDASAVADRQAQRLYHQGMGEAKDAYRDASKQFRPAARLGRNALRAYSSNLGIGKAPKGYDLSMTPGSQFLMDKMNESVQGSAAADGGLYSGATMEALQREGAGIAALDRDTQQGQLFSLAGMGQQAGANIANLRTGLADRRYQYGSDKANALTNSADTLASRRIGIGDTRMTNLGAARTARGNLLGSAAQGYATGGSNALSNHGQAGASSAMGWGNALAGGLNSGFGMYGYMGGQMPGAAPMGMGSFGMGGQGRLY